MYNNVTHLYNFYVLDKLYRCHNTNFKSKWIIFTGVIFTNGIQLRWTSDIRMIFQSAVAILYKLACSTNQGITDMTDVFQFESQKGYRQVSNIRRTLVGNKIVDHSDVVGAIWRWSLIILGRLTISYKDICMVGMSKGRICMTEMTYAWQEALLLFTIPHILWLSESCQNLYTTPLQWRNKRYTLYMTGGPMAYTEHIVQKRFALSHGM